jgi:hypothetical protein
MRNLLKFIAISILISIPIFSASTEETASPAGEAAGGTLEGILTKIKDTLKDLGYIVCIIFMIWGGYLMITSSGDPTKFEKGKTALLYAAIGFVIILLADKIVNFIKDIISGTSEKGAPSGGGGGGGRFGPPYKLK